jgi:hypothetical protein
MEITLGLEWVQVLLFIIMVLVEVMAVHGTIVVVVMVALVVVVQVPHLLVIMVDLRCSQHIHQILVHMVLLRAVAIQGLEAETTHQVTLLLVLVLTLVAVVVEQDKQVVTHH